jgi:Arylsulfotransferase (ASST)/Cep192 domain 4/Secretion system C-terminal sorting domain
MRYYISRIFPQFFSLILLSILINCELQAQSVNTNLYQYLSPVPDAIMVMPSSCIIIRLGNTYSSLSSNSINNIIVKGEKSGVHKGKLLLLENNKTISFKPFKPFNEGETVTVELKNNFTLIDGETNPSLKFSFTIIKKKSNNIIDHFFYLKSEIGESNHQKITSKKINLIQDDLPADFPEYTVNYNNPFGGYIFFTPFIVPDLTPTYLIVTDNYGIPIFYRKMSAVVFDFQKQANGSLTYYDGGDYTYYVMNNKYEIIDSLNMKNGYTADLHELRILENGHSLMFSYDYEHVRMDTVVAGGDSNAVVVGLVLQELDENKNLLFQWRSWDHFKITDATDDIDLTASVIDCIHANAIEVDYDGNILLSCRHMDEITKIDRTTGNIIWRWGGIHCKNNQFIFLNDTIGFSHQHCIRRLSNGNYTIFDNGNLHNPQFSRTVEYQMDETNKIVTLIWEYRNNPSTYSSAMGSVERLGNHNTFIGWGVKGNSPDILEVGPGGAQMLSITFPDTVCGYRAFKYDWDTDFFTSDKDSLAFGIVPVGESATVSFNLTNNSNQTIEINSTFNRDSSFSFQQQLPIVISAYNSVNLSVKFTPDNNGAFFDALHLRWETTGQRIAKIICLYGYTDSVYTNINDYNNPKDFTLSQNYPNPFNPVSKIKYSVSHSSLVKLQVFDILGKEVSTLVNEEQSPGSYEVEINGTNLASGIYFYRLIAGSFSATKKMLLLK